MSALLENIKKKAIARAHSNVEADESTSSVIPETSRIADLELGQLLNGSWERRRVVITSDTVYFAAVGDDVEMDHIPLIDIDDVKDLRGQAFLGDGEEAALYQNAIQIATNVDGYNAGRIYYIQGSSEEECQKVSEDLKRLAKEAKKEMLQRSRLDYWQHRTRTVYNSPSFQSFVASFIMANFIATLVEAQQIDKITRDDGTPTRLGTILNNLNLFFTVTFTAEIIMNAFGHWFWPFVRSAWNMMDLFVVLMSLAAVLDPDQPTGVVRIIRALRVIRIFGRFESLKKIIAALTSSILPVMNVFVILMLLIGIAAVMGVAIFRDDHPVGFGKFNVAFLTMFRVTSADEWPPNLSQINDDGTVNLKVSLFLTAYTILVNWVILQEPSRRFLGPNGAAGR